MGEGLGILYIYSIISTAFKLYKVQIICYKISVTEHYNCYQLYIPFLLLHSKLERIKWFLTAFQTGLARNHRRRELLNIEKNKFEWETLNIANL